MNNGIYKSKRCVYVVFFSYLNRYYKYTAKVQKYPSIAVLSLDRLVHPCHNEHDNYYAPIII